MSSTPSTNELVILGAPIALRDGSHVRIRQGHRSDRELLLRGFDRLSRKLIRIAAEHDVAVPLAHRDGPRRIADSG